MGEGSVDAPGEPQRLVEAFSATALVPSTGIIDAKRLAEWAPVGLWSKAVTYADDDCFYIEDDFRACGIRVEKSGHGITPGMRGNVSDSIGTSSYGERYIDAEVVTPNGAGTVSPLFVNIRDLGGADLLYNPLTSAGQKGVFGGYGLNNIGLLVTVCGRAADVDIDGRIFYVKAAQGLEVKVAIPDGVTMPAPEAFVVVTGPNSCESTADGVRPVVLARQQDGILEL